MNIIGFNLVPEINTQIYIRHLRMINDATSFYTILLPKVVYSMCWRDEYDRKSILLIIMYVIILPLCL